MQVMQAMEAMQIHRIHRLHRMHRIPEGCCGTDAGINQRALHTLRPTDRYTQHRLPRDANGTAQSLQHDPQQHLQLLDRRQLLRRRQYAALHEWVALHQNTYPQRFARALDLANERTTT